MTILLVDMIEKHLEAFPPGPLEHLGPRETDSYVCWVLRDGEMKREVVAGPEFRAMTAGAGR